MSSMVYWGYEEITFGYLRDIQIIKFRINPTDANHVVSKTKKTIQRLNRAHFE